jgi:putative sigma-54 modulation protein
MQLDLSGHHVEVTEAMRGYVFKKFERISRHFEQLIDVHCVLTVEKLRHSDHHAEEVIRARSSS